MKQFDPIGHNSAATALLARFDEFPPGCDPDFDNGLELLEREFAELRLAVTNE